MLPISNSYYIPKTDIREFIKRTKIPTSSLGIDPESYKVINESKVVSTTNSEHLTLSEYTWLYIMMHSMLVGAQNEDLVRLKLVLFAKYLGVLEEGEESMAVTSPIFLKAPILLDELIYHVLYSKHDILINLYSSGAIEFITITSDPSDEKPKDAYIVRTFSIHQILKAIPPLKNVPDLRSSNSVLSAPEQAVLQNLRKASIKSMQISKGPKEYLIKPTEHGIAHETVIDTWKNKRKVGDELSTIVLQDKGMYSYKKTSKIRVKL